MRAEQNNPSGLNTMIPFFRNLDWAKSRWRQLNERVDAILENGDFNDGRRDARPVLEFEQAIQNFTGAKHAIAVGNATDALIISLEAAGIGPGDEVICPAMSFFASASSIALVGAKPIFVDIEPGTYAIHPERAATQITRATKAIMPVHLFSQMADMTKVSALAQHHGLQVIEDSAEAIGMRWDGVHAGLMGRGGVISFFPTKTLGAWGDAGIIVTNDADFAATCRRLRHHGASEADPFTYEEIGLNSRLDSLQAAILTVGLKDVPQFIARRQQLASIYDARLAHLEPLISLPRFHRDIRTTNPVHYVYLIECDDRDNLAADLASQGIGTEKYYPLPLHLQPIFRGLGYREGDCPNAERACRRSLALPLYPDLTEAQVMTVCKAVEAHYGNTL